MGTSLIRYSALAFLLTTSSGFADGGSCDGILVWGAANTFHSTNSESANAALYNENCGVEASKMSNSQRAKANVTIFGEGGGDASYDTQTINDKINQWCYKNKQSSNTASANDVAARNIFAPSVQAWSQCKSLEAGGTTLNPAFIKNTAATFNLSYTGSGSGLLFYGVKAKNFTCTTRGPRGDGGIVDITDTELKSGVNLKGQAVVIHCDRFDPHKVTENGQDYDIWDQGYISIDTAGRTPLVFSFEKDADPPLPTRKADELTANLEALKKIVDSNDRKLEGYKAQLAQDASALKSLFDEFYRKEKSINYAIANSGGPCPDDFSYAGPAYIPTVTEQNAEIGPFKKGGVLPGGSWVQDAWICKRQ